MRGVRAFPPGRVRNETAAVLNAWGRRVADELDRHNP